MLDDLGAERPTEWVRDTFAYILNSRYNRKLTTVITTNFEDRRSRNQNYRGWKPAADGGDFRGTHWSSVAVTDFTKCAK